MADASDDASPDTGFRNLSLRLDPIEAVPGGARTAETFDTDVAVLSARIEDMISAVTDDVNARLTAGRLSSQRIYGLTVAIGLMVILFIMYVNLRLARYVVDPVNDIVGSITEFRRGDYSARTGVKRTDEIGALANAFNEMAANIEQTHAHLSSLTERDPLTGMLNRRSFDPRFDLHLKQAEAAQREMAVVMVDVDHFKKVMTATAMRSAIRCWWLSPIRSATVCVRAISPLAWAARNSSSACRMRGAKPG
ncbi:HAMP domain-containing protein [Breoghania sp.]|uniref:HAMP domain-containing protein n=1 Tax=Breoghania sp. TaxID=2065378 RepID=UPI00260228F9|nr:HAMP domain-containing protein [Breoghania sp.]MDJ0933131.1 HAMP domain-containing protein [Breoghania sp.]